MKILWISLALATTLSAQPAARTALVVTADQTDWVLAAGGTIARLADEGVKVHLLRVGNDEKESWSLSPEETALNARQESEAAAKILGVAEVHSLGYRSGELGGVQHTELRDRILFYIRKHKPQILFFPNPYAEYVEVLDRFYVGKAAEDAWRSAPLENVQPAFAHVGLGTHIVDEVYYYAQPFDPRRREPESTATFVPQPAVRDVAKTFDKKVSAAQALTTANQSMAQRIKQRLDETGRRLPLLDDITTQSVNELVSINVRKLAEMAAQGSEYELAEEFHHAGIEYQIPKKYLE
jgi:LmbE family N-acetylglucosaminyl deacetylase